jgi:methyl-accepting chemotaxis protein
MDGSDYYMAVLLKQSGNVLLYSVPASVYKEELSGIASGILVLIILLVLLTILTMIYFSGKLSRPLIYMVDMLEQSDNGILKLRDTKASFGEMNSLIASYNEAGERIVELIK